MKMMKRSLDDLIGKKETINLDGESIEVMFPKEGTYKILGKQFVIYSLFPKFTRPNRGAIDDRINRYYGEVDIIGDKVYKKKYE